MISREDHKAIVKALYFKEERNMKVILWLKESSEPLEYECVKNTYTKGDLFCVYLDNEKVHKFPINTIFRIVEDYGHHGDRDTVCTKPPVHENTSLNVAKKVYDGPYDNYSSGVKSNWDAFESVEGDPEVERVTILPRNRRMSDYEVPHPNHDPAGILKNDDVV